MPLAIELFLDDEARRAVRAAWRRLDGAGVRSLGSVPGAEYEPHVSLIAFDDADPAVVARAVARAVVSPAGVPLTLTSLGFFLTDESPAFLAVLPTRRLLELHARIAEAVRPHVRGIWPYYEVDALQPHCTLAMHVADRCAVTDALDELQLPIAATASALHLVDVATGGSMASLDL